MDLLLLHAPSVYDFRKKAILYGPVSDMVPSSTVFEMYPLGFLTMASYLHDRGMQVRIVNLALRMMNSRRFDVPRFLARQKPKAVGIDLHWLPHAHGALEVARIVKELHPDVPVIMGGLSSSYFHRELIGYPQVDYVLRGDSTEPPLHQLLLALESGAPVDKIPNLTWKDAAGIHVNPLTFVPMSLDYVDLRPDLMVEMVLRYRDLESTLPFNGWWTHPVTAVLTVKGCAFECVTCGSSHTTCTPFDEAAEARAPQSREFGRQSASDLPSDTRPHRIDRRPSHGRTRARRRGARTPARSGFAERDHVRILRRAAGVVLAATSTAACATGAWNSAPKATSRRCATLRRARPATPPRTWNR